MRKNLLAFAFGWTVVAILLGTLELFFRANEKYQFLPVPVPERPYFHSNQELRPVAESAYEKAMKLGVKTYGNSTQVEAVAPKPVALDASLKYGLDRNYGRMVLDNYIFKPNIKYRSIVKLENKDITVYDIGVTIDERSRRYTTRSSASESSDRGVLFFGDSFTFGEGVENDETFASQFAKLNPQLQVFNYGIGGSSVFHFLKEIEQFPQHRYTNTDLPPKNIGIYVLIDDTVDRMLCRLNCYWQRRSWIQGLPSFSVDKEGVFQYQGTFREARPFLTPIGFFLGGSALLKYLQVDFPPRIRGKDIDMLAHAIKQFWDRSKKHINIDRFVVVSFPGSQLKYKDHLESFKSRGLEFWDFNGVEMVSITDSQNILPWDGHPSPIGHFITAELLNYQFQKTSQLSDSK